MIFFFFFFLSLNAIFCLLDLAKRVSGSAVRVLTRLMKPEYLITLHYVNSVAYLF